MTSWPKTSGEELQRRLALGAVIADTMRVRHMAMAELARLMNVSRQAVYSGLKQGLWTQERLREAADVLGLEVEVEVWFTITQWDRDSVRRICGFSDRRDRARAEPAGLDHTGAGGGEPG